MAGLLTDSLPDAFPTLTIDTWSVVKVNIKKLNGVSQQRDCPGFTPDSLLIQIVYLFYARKKKIIDVSSGILQSLVR